MFMLNVCKRLTTSQRGPSILDSGSAQRVGPQWSVRSYCSWRWVDLRLPRLPRYGAVLADDTVSSTALCYSLPHRGCHLAHRDVVRVVAIRGNININAMTLYGNTDTDKANSIQNYLRSPLSPSCTLPLGLLLFLISDT